MDTLPGAPVTSPVFAREAIQFLDAHRDKPFFLYVPFNAVHAPHDASPQWMDKYAHLTDRRSRAYAAMIAEVDEAVGAVMTRLRQLKLEENTLIFCIGDNGGAAMQAEMGGLRGRKWTLYEGGIRVPFLVQWKGRIPAGRVSSEPVIQLDVLATSLAAAGGKPLGNRTLDGVDLLPLLEGRVNSTGRDTLYWRYGPQYAIRKGEWKLVRVAPEGKPRLYRLSTDPGEQRDLAAAEPARVQELQSLWDRWNATMPPPRWEDRRWNDGEARATGQKSDTKKKRKKQ
jgi:arylsulfatase A-like enzyme